MWDSDGVRLTSQLRKKWQQLTGKEVVLKSAVTTKEAYTRIIVTIMWKVCSLNLNKSKADSM